MTATGASERVYEPAEGPSAQGFRFAVSPGIMTATGASERVYEPAEGPSAQGFRFAV